MGKDLVTHIAKKKCAETEFSILARDLNEGLAKTFCERGNYII